MEGCPESEVAVQEIAKKRRAEQLPLSPDHRQDEAFVTTSGGRCQ